MPTLAVVVVSYSRSEADALSRTLPAVTRELRDGDQLVMVDNSSGDGNGELVACLAPDAIVVQTGGNLGFAAACNAGAAAAQTELVCFLNPDAVPQLGFRSAIERPALDGSGWTAWQALVMSDEGRTVSSAGGVLHFTGLAWAGAAGRPRGTRIARMGFLSGACLVIDRERFQTLRGFPADYFIYHEDVDLSLRVLLEGGAIGLCSDAIVDHDYDFDKGTAKWRRLERNRWATIVRTYPPALFVLLLPALVVTEVAVFAAAVRGSWWRQKALATWDSTRRLPSWLGQRGEIQRGRTISSYDFTEAMVATLDSDYLGDMARAPFVAGSLRLYWSAVRAVLKVSTRRDR